mmetsp:Transcript_16664/g.36130  ORF Transcript_16664/g.36130 Transcript_16664/m.36130 type:complete len:202 (-) Transcript_16664:136-741(-)
MSARLRVHRASLVCESEVDLVSPLVVAVELGHTIKGRSTAVVILQSVDELLLGRASLVHGTVRSHLVCENVCDTMIGLSVARPIHAFGGIVLVRTVRERVCDVRNGIVNKLLDVGCPLCKVLSPTGFHELLTMSRELGDGLGVRMSSGLIFLQLVDHSGQSPSNLRRLWSCVHYSALGGTAALWMNCGLQHSPIDVPRGFV